jgi:DNA polymerase-3 subunit delta
MLRHSNLNEQGIMHMSMEELKKQLKENKIGKLYLFTGSERYLIRYYVKEITDKILDQDTKTFNFTEYEGKVAFQQLSDTVSMFPAFSERRVVIIRESSLLKPGAGEINWKGFFESLPDYICLIFIQEEVDKRVSFYKTIKNCGLIVECRIKQDEQALAKWAMKVFASLKKQLTRPTPPILSACLNPT